MTLPQGTSTGTGNGAFGVYGNGGVNGFFGVFGISAVAAGSGVRGDANVANGTGVTGVANSGTNAVAVRGQADLGTGVVGTGVFGVWGATSVSAAGNAGVRGTSNIPGTLGVSGIVTNVDANSAAIYGESVAPGFAGFFAGKVAVSGALSKGGGSFKIDHPLDPANKYLYHSFVESPDMMNIYNGIANLDSTGSAQVQMPSWFNALNSDFRYQLTAIGAPGPNLYIAREVDSNGTFAISGGSSGMKVSWQITGIRQDKWAKANRIPVEEVKRPDERGRFLHPELFGFGNDRSVIPHVRARLAEPAAGGLGAAASK